MTFLFHAHSGLRYLVLLVAAVALGYFAFGLATRRTAGKDVRILGSAYVGLLDLQTLLGTFMVVLGRYYPALIGHIVMMLLAVGLTHVLLVKNRKRPQPGFLLPLIAVGASLLLVIGGILAIGRGVFTTTTGFGG